MALTKHQKLAKELNTIFSRLDLFYEKVSKILKNIVQFHFYESYLIIGRPLRQERTLKTMMYTHKLGMIIFSPNLALRKICLSKQFFGAILFPPIYKKSDIRANKSENCNNTKSVFPWKVKIYLPDEALEGLKKSYNKALLYCASKNEMSEWLDWYDKEDEGNSFTNLVLTILTHLREQAILKRNLIKASYPHFIKEIEQFYGKLNLEKAIKTLSKTEFIPNEDTSISQAYEKVLYSLKSRKNRHHDEFKHSWKNVLEEIIFKDLSWTAKKQKDYFEKWFLSKQKTTKKERWSTGRSIDRQTYSAFIQYFSKTFLKKPTTYKAYGEVVLFLWLAVHIAQDPDNTVSIKEILSLTTSKIENRTICLNTCEVEITQGLADLILAFIGQKSVKKHQKIFPNLSVDRLEDLCHKASEIILPEEKVPILPEAFLTFPHSYEDMRIISKHRKEQQKTSTKIYFKMPSWRDIQKHLRNNSKI
ncbi:MAG: hypothetical protein JXA94_05790 [Parachlamydiales bacterium]|nr:hypothetical protein [Parachlamydiales bacterium]